VWNVREKFEKASEISQIDIGNEGSAFVEVLVGKSSAKEEDYQVCRALHTWYW